MTGYQARDVGVLYLQTGQHLTLSLRSTSQTLSRLAAVAANHSLWILLDRQL